MEWSKEQFKAYYEVDYQKTNSLVNSVIQTPKEHFNDRLKTIEPIYERILPLLSPEIRVLEVGCGAGELLWRIKPLVSECVGVELNGPFVHFINDSLGIKCYGEDINKLSLDNKFDLIISIATLDHLPNPLETLQTMKNLLTPNGRLYIEVPNLDEALNRFIPENTRRKFNEFFWHRAHLFYFDRETIARLFNKVGLEIEISCRHEYTLWNFLNWYFVGQPQPCFVEGVGSFEFFKGESEFEKQMNSMFEKMEKEFKKIMAESFTGDILCCSGWAKGESD